MVINQFISFSQRLLKYQFLFPHQPLQPLLEIIRMQSVISLHLFAFNIAINVHRHINIIAIIILVFISEILHYP